MNTITTVRSELDEFVHKGNSEKFEKFLVRHFVGLEQMDDTVEMVTYAINPRRWERKHIRIDAVYPIHVSILQNESVVNQTMGKTLNLSESGAYIETNISILPSHTVSVTLALEEFMMDLEGKVIHRCKHGKFFRTGIKFANPDANAMVGLKRFINKSRQQNKKDRRRSMSRIYIRELAGAASNRLLRMSS